MQPDKATLWVLEALAREDALSVRNDDIAAARKAYDKVFSCWTRTAASPGIETAVDIETGDGPAKVIIVNPRAGDICGTIIFIHGGGWSLGSAACYTPLAHRLAELSSMRVVVPDYPLAPEAPYPAALDALRMTARWVADNFAGPVILAGDSAGGALAAVLSGDEALCGSIAAQLLFYPVLDLRPDAHYPSRRQMGAGEYFLTEEAILGAAEGYCGNGGDPADPRISPIVEPDPGRLPPTFIAVAELDPLKDEALHYAGLLRQAGVSVETHLIKNTIHGCVSFSGKIPTGDDALVHATKFLVQSVIPNLRQAQP